ncbi:MAG: NAD-dependent epimerase/dehydratase family protein [Deltaproteobacteria bacterium]|nr:NAD-dependent epimerase/dehydratase family protein [Deltaproteobacteria bacterium]
MDIAVTGGSGFVGRHVARALLAAGASVRLLVRDAGRVPDELRDRCRVVVGDVTRPETIPALVTGATHVVHMAAVVGSGGTGLDGYRAVHVSGTRVLTEAAARAGVERFVHLSSVGIYGDTGPLGASEVTPAHPQDAYELSKWEGEEVAREVASRTGLPLVVLRPAGVYGRWDRRLLKLFRGVSRGRFVMIGPGSCRYHLVHVDDVAAAIGAALEHPAAVGQDFIVAGPESVVLSDLVARVAKLAGRASPSVRIPLAPVLLAARLTAAVCRPLGLDPPLYPERVAFFTKQRVYSIDKARHLLGFTPRVDLDQGLARTLLDYRADGWL